MDVSQLIEQARTAYPARSQASNRLSELGHEALDAVIGELRSGEQRYWSLWWNIILDMSDPAVVPALVPLLTEKDNVHVQTVAYDVMSRKGGEGAFEALVAALGQRRFRDAAIRALGDLGDVRAIEPLRQQVGKLLEGDFDRDAVRRLADAARAEQYMGDLRMLVSLVASLARLGDQSLGHVVLELAAFDRDSPPDESEAYLVRAEAVAAMCHVVVPGMRDTLVTALQDPVPDVREPAIRTSLLLGDPRFVEHWIASTADPMRDLAAAALQAIRDLTGRDPAGIGSVREADPLRLESWWSKTMRAFGERVVYRLGKPLHIPDLFPLLNDRGVFEDVRAELRCITGVDFAPAVVPFWALDLDGESRARAWWQENHSRFEPGGLYRHGRRYDLNAT